jgi:hypothetical protein
MKIQIENLRAQMRGVQLNAYQRGLALDEYYKLLDYVDELEKLTIPDVVKSLPTDECVEQWWAEGKESDKFWQEAPYRTNGDVVEEIKTALKYFITVWQ